MSRRVKEFVDVADHVSIDDLIQKLSDIRASLPHDADAELRLRGDEIFGHRITISYFRDQTKEEAEVEKRYAEQLARPRNRNSPGSRPNSGSSATPRRASAGSCGSSLKLRPARKFSASPFMQ